jgi:hypothetical protein
MLLADVVERGEPHLSDGSGLLISRPGDDATRVPGPPDPSPEGIRLRDPEERG